MPFRDDAEVIIIGAGLAGLSCAVHLREAGITARIIEAGDGIGGRVRTDQAEGFTFDRGFQVVLDAYPEFQRQLDVAALDLRHFEPGALIWADGAFHTVADPWRHPLLALRSVVNPVGTFADKMRVLQLVRRATAEPLADTLSRRETTTLEVLNSIGFSEEMITRFFRPFLGGIMLDRELRSTSRMLDFVIRMMARGGTGVPAKGMQEIPRQLAARIPEDTILVRTPVTSLSEEGAVTLQGGKVLHARAVVLATDGPTASKLLRGRIPDPGSRSVTCLYYTADRSPVEGPWLVLNGERRALVNNVAVMSEVAPEYAPAGQHLISVTVLGVPAENNVQLDRAVRAELRTWYGSAVGRWQYLRGYRIHHAQPMQHPGANAAPGAKSRISDRVYVCGDHRDTVSINGALRSGRKTATILARNLRRELAAL